MSRKVMKITGPRRRSPRISALDKSKDDHQSSSRTSRDKRSLENVAAALPPISKLAKQVWKGRDSPETTADCVEWRSLKENQKGFITSGQASVMPEKHILELVLDTLQRRDTHEIFAQPVDPHEVEEYYEIIKEPMDFGTMRAKLHEGMYKDLQQFEHDVFLIPENAMHFNSSRTIYFRQGRAIHELASKVFHVLKTKPESFVSAFSGSRRRSIRKALTTHQTFQTPSSPSTNPPPKTNFFTVARGSREGAVWECDEAAATATDSKKSRRDTYLSTNPNPDPVHSTFLSSCQSLPLLGMISYKESLMSYVKELGPTALAVAERKLQLHGDGGDEHQDSKRRMSCSGGRVELKTFRDFAPPPGAGSGCSSSNPFAKAARKTMNVRGKRREKSVEIPTHTHKPPPFSNRNCSVILALENHHSHRFFKSRNINIVKKDEDDGLPQRKPLPLTSHSHFTFDLHFLKARLRQMKKPAVI